MANVATATLMITCKLIKSFNAFVAFGTKFPFENCKTPLEKSNLDGVKSLTSGKN